MRRDRRSLSPLFGDRHFSTPPRESFRSNVMTLFADLVLDPGGVVAWLVVGLIAGWAAGQVMKGTGFGLLGDIVVGLIGAFIGGAVFGILQGSQSLWSTGFWGSVLVAFLGACLLLYAVRFMAPERDV